jgi:hypothetical protein
VVNPLICQAVEQNSATLIDLLVKLGANMHEENLDHDFPLEIAIRTRRNKVAKKLLQLGAQIKKEKASPYEAAFDAKKTAEEANNMTILNDIRKQEIEHMSPIMLKLQKWYYKYLR